MNKIRISSRILRLAAAAGALMVLVSQNPAARAAAPAFQAPPVIPIPNLAALWKLDEVAGTTADDSSGNNNAGQHWNSPVISTDVSPAPAPGNLRSLAFAATGGTQRVNVPDSSSLRISGPLTISTWLKPTADTPDYHKGVVEKWTDGATDINGYMFRMGYPDKGNNVPTFSLGNGTSRIGVDTGVAIPKNLWTHVAAVYDGANMMLYVNGALSASTPNAGAVVPTAANTNELHLGSDYGTEVFTGNIDETRIYNRGINDVEVGILINGQQPPTGVSAAPIPGGNRITWLAPAAPATGIHYSLLYGSSAGTYTGVINNISATSYDDFSAATGVPTYYSVVAVTVLASTNTSDVASTPDPAAPPGPPPPPRTRKLGERHMCGWSTVSASSWPGLLGLALMAAAVLLRRKAKA
jgi:MYXO-CTERM domain-containing protein